MAYKRILTIQDISCVGQCSMTVALPVLSAWGHETCILPTAVLSTHTGGFGRPSAAHLDGYLGDFRRHWQENNILFDAVLIGYLGSVGAVTAAGEILDTMLAPGGVAIVDPAMADHGKLYAGFDEEYARAVGELCGKADIVIPNLTEAAILSGTPYREDPDRAWVDALVEGLPHKDLILTGVGLEQGRTGVLTDGPAGRQYYAHDRIGKSYHGTGDLFAACFTGAYLQGRDMYEAAKIAADFVCRSIRNTVSDPAHWYGVKFETALPWLMEQIDRK